MSGPKLVDRFGDMYTETAFEDGKIIQKRTQDVDDLFSENQALLNDAPGKFAAKPKMRMMRRVPLSAWFEIIVNKMGLPPSRIYSLTPDEKRKFRDYLNDREYSKTRTDPGNL